MKKRRLATGALSIALALTMMSTSAFAAAVEFTDVPSDHWASGSIAEMAEKGIMAGLGNNQFAPDKTFTYAEFLTMLTRQFYSDKIGGGSDVWYDPFVAAAESADILSGISMSSPTDSINRYEMAQLMYNVMGKQGIALPSSFDTSKIGDWASIPANYQKAVSACYSLGTLSGTDGDGTFSGNNVMTRAQAAVVMDRLIAVCTNSSSGVPVGTVQILPGDPAITKVSNGTPIEGGYEFDTSGAINAAGSDRLAGMLINLGGKYSTLTFTLTAHDRATACSVNSSDNSLQPTLLSQEQLYRVVNPGESSVYVVNVSGIHVVGIRVGSYMASGAITNIYLW